MRYNLKMPTMELKPLLNLVLLKSPVTGTKQPLEEKIAWKEFYTRLKDHTNQLYLTKRLQSVIELTKFQTCTRNFSTLKVVF